MKITVRLGDSLWYYSQLFNIPVILIETSNPGVNALQIQVGQEIKIPGYLRENYTIEPNDTFWTLAIENNIPLDLIELMNSTIDPSQLEVGQTIYLPKRVTEFVVDDITNYTYERMVTDINELLSIYPFIMKRSIGSSVMGKDITELQIGAGPTEVHLNGSFHANEWITTPIIMRFINEYALSLTNGLPINDLATLPMYQATLFSAVPMVNPDGVNLVIQGASAAGDYSNSVLAINQQSEDFSGWKANINGVDLNNQFPALWEIEADRKPTTPQPRDFPGTAPLTEPEAIAMANLAEERNFRRMNAFHTQGKVIFWGFEGLEPPESAEIVSEYERVSGYTPIQYVDSYAGYKDWFIQEFRRPGFTVELGEGVNPLPIEQFQEIYEDSLGIMLANLYL
ncbi:M14 family metallopeptidase [Oceanobacillus profundus]|uniref:LysM peptidoglycan-binding domain-containing protein n=1 Tax=Oceanobacillus profundus TaxID=372463 RepID=A0A417YG20_9BACI|nr:M14 family metallopeptidase [Oceanobacillus profundus]MCM3396680.1 M14 family metallopeptidase [Oceanobacillus profundus]PAE29813.1 peptidase M14 [Paenibacillus sp. 7884-2]RHW31637.1 LysM peptidoglycan-binding domain-containing protein [Oceanobacillus profundus]